MSEKTLRIGLLNGLNMTSLGKRDKNIYGIIGSLQELEDLVSEAGKGLGVEVVPFHSNHEGDLVDFIEEHDEIDAWMINPGGLWAFGEPTKLALHQSGKPFVEVHFANIFATGHDSVFTSVATGTVMGFRHFGYLGALVALVEELKAGRDKAA
ncbi:type II 3-dehydroquinate dehydratase [Shinella zoogloeoides]|uniref:type II 3-dehydroquinate dehydratase n=1 Tax=Shinella zoogloeoides TaxID=352475 RepID=UPI00299F3B06|nr:type II 3-dehydroquinate dehydratase [Shinella zoogloeoides]WPE24211.1 3-dehydroquinate dehydratase [Shinella zoogloeoides]